MHKANEQRKQKYKWLYEKEQLSIENNSNDSIKLIEGSNQEKPAEISTWKYKVRNSLMFYPEGHQTQNIEDHSRAPPKKIVHDATRFESAEEMILQVLRSASQTPRVGGYSFVPATPSPNPSQIDSSELMTWGMVEGTPLLIGGDQTPGPAFHLPPTSRREIIGMELSSNASRNMRKRNLSLKSPRITSITQSPFSNKISSPRIRATLLSPAARNLLRKSHHRLSSTKSNQQR
nr:16049_t:CDS:2 [Entrophospora candida]